MLDHAPDIAAHDDRASSDGMDWVFDFTARASSSEGRVRSGPAAFTGAYRGAGGVRHGAVRRSVDGFQAERTSGYCASS